MVEGMGWKAPWDVTIILAKDDPPRVNRSSSCGGGLYSNSALSKPPEIKRSERSRPSQGLSPQGELRSAGRVCSRGGSPDSSVDAGDQGVTAAVSQRASGRSAPETPPCRSGASRSTCPCGSQIALRANGVFRRRLTPAAGGGKGLRGRRSRKAGD